MTDGTGKSRPPHPRRISAAVLLATLATACSPALGDHPDLCEKWRPGHYIRVPVGQGNAGLLAQVLRKNLTHFQGIQYQFDWSRFEKVQGEYDFSLIDDAVARVTALDKSLLLMMMDRTFTDGCDSGFVPDYIKRVGSERDERFCTAAIWEPEVMDHRIRVLAALLEHYADNPRVLGIVLPETALAIRPRTTPGFTWRGYQGQLRRSYHAIHAAAPNMLVIQAFNFPQERQRPGFMSGLRQSLQDMGRGGGISWPDTVPKRFREWDQYRMAKLHNRNLAIVPQVQTPQIEATDTEEIYTHLVEDIGAQMIIWSHWHRDMDDYLGKEVIATVNRHQGFIRNSACPFQAYAPPPRRDSRKRTALATGPGDS